MKDFNEPDGVIHLDCPCGQSLYVRCTSIILGLFQTNAHNFQVTHQHCVKEFREAKITAQRRQAVANCHLQALKR